MGEDRVPLCQDNNLLENTDVSTPLRLTGGGDTSFECLENINLDSQGNGLLDNSKHDALSFLNQDSSIQLMP